MEYLFYIIITLFILIPVISAKANITNNVIEKNKAFTSASTKLIFAVLLSIILSVFIALNNNMNASSGHGGFLYILGPLFFGLIVLVFYIASLGIKPELKFISGLISIVINICIGFYYMFSKF